jgi:HAE1 family hydrophobic/amphiphilic exporter-1
LEQHEDKTKLKRRINPIARFAVERRVTMGMAVLGIVVLGYLSLQRLPLEFLPEMSRPSMWVQAPYNSSSPEEVERIIVRPLEDILGTVNGIETLSVRASASQGSVSLSFEDGTDMDLAAVEVRDRIDRIRHLLPSDLRRVFIRRFQSTDMPVFRLQVSADWERDRLYFFVENVLQRRLERLEGVAQIDAWGLNQRQVEVQIHPARMRSHGIGVREISTALRTNNVNVSGGWVKEGGRKLVIRSIGEFQTLDEIQNLPLRGNGIRLSDVADVAFTYPRQDSFNFLNGQEALTVSVYKASTANLLDVVDRVKVELDEIQKLQSAQGIRFRPLRDSSVDIRKGLGQLRNAGLLGGGLAILFLFFFLRKVRTTLLVAIAIPISVVLTFVIMYFSRQMELSNITINIISLMGLMLAVGMLVDNSIVVIEAIFRRFQDLGEDAKTAALRGTSEVAMPIIASTTTTICVFVPLVFLGSGGGFMRFMTDVGTTICIVMVSSLLVALTVVPMVATILMKGESSQRSSIVDWLVRNYGIVIGFTLKHRFSFFLSILAMLYGSWLLFGTIERSFSPRTMERQVALYIDTPRHFTIEQKAELHEDVFQLLMSKKDELEIKDISYRYRRGSGRSRGGFGGGSRVDVILTDEEESKLSTREIQGRIREILPVKPGINFRLAQSRGRHGGGMMGISLDLSGDDLGVLELVAERVVKRLEEIPFIKDVDTSLESGDEEVHVEVNRERALAAGLSTQAVAMTINNALTSRPVSRLKTEEREVDLVMQFREEDRQTLDQLKKMPVFNTANALPIGALADFRMEKGPRTIERENRRPEISITANTSGPSSSFRMLGQVREIMESVNLPPGYEWSFGRWARHAQQDFGEAGFSLLFAMLLIYLIMAALFENFIQPLTIMFSIPFAFIGVGIVLKITNQPLDNTSNLGLIILVGVVVNNAIVLIDHINHLRWEGMSRTEAVILGGKHRLRPILMTALTTLLGLTPMVAPLLLPGWLGTPEGNAANWAPVGLVIMAGLAASTALTLIIIPTIYSIMDDFLVFMRRVIRAA